MSDAAYPPAPWHLRGWGVAALALAPVARAAAFVPAGASVVPLLPGKTLAGIIFLSYENGSTLVYRELAIVAALVRAGRRIALRIPRLYVDDAAAQAGGTIWGLVKERATFGVLRERARCRIVVRSGEREVCRLEATREPAGIPVRLPVPAIGVCDAALLQFTGDLRARATPARVRVSCLDAAFAAPQPRACLGASLDELTFSVPPPRSVRR